MSDNPASDRHPSSPDPGDAAVARVNALRAARGLDPLPEERDPAIVREELGDTRSAALIALATLRPDRGGAVPDAIQAALTGQHHVHAGVLPQHTALAIRDRLPEQYRAAFIAAATPELTRFNDGPERGWERATLSVFRIGDTVRAAIADTIANEVRAEHPAATTDDVTQATAVAADIVLDQLRATLWEAVKLYAGLPMPDTATDADLEYRCRRASVMNMLAQVRVDDAMQSEAARLAITVCHDHPGMRPSDVFRAGVPLLILTDIDPAPADLEAALLAELAALNDRGV